MPNYFKIRNQVGNATQPYIATPGNEALLVGKNQNDAVTAYIAGTNPNGPNLPVVHRGLTTVAFGNLANYRLHNFATGLDLANGLIQNDR